MPGDGYEADRRGSGGAEMNARTSGAGHILGTDSAALRHPAVLALGLLVVAGYVDAFVFLRVAEVFTANQSGNLIVAGIALGSHPAAGTVLPVVAVLAYVVGAALAVALFDQHDGGRRRIIGVLGTLIVVLVTLTLLLHVAGMGHERGGPRAVVYVTVALAAMSMGSQATAIARVNGIPVLTTAGSGAVTNLGIALGRCTDAPLRREAVRMIRMLGGTALAYVGGAALGALACTATSLGPVLLLLPVVALAAMVTLPLKLRRQG